MAAEMVEATKEVPKMEARSTETPGQSLREGAGYPVASQEEAVS